MPWKVDIFEGAVTFQDESPVDVKVDNIRGLILDMYRGNLRLRASYQRAAVDMKLPALDRIAGLFRGLGFRKRADSLGTTGDVSFMQAGISYDTLDYFLKAEWTRMSADVSTFHTIEPYDGYYLSGGYTFYPFELPITAHATFANFTTTGIPRPVNEISTNPFLPSWVVNNLQSFYTRTFDSRAELSDDLDSLNIGLRWDVNPAVALKAEWVHLRGERGLRSLFTVDQAPDFDRKANLFLLGLEWVF